MRWAVLIAMSAGAAWQGTVLPGEYAGRPYQDNRYHDGPQRIPGRVQCAYYDLGGEGVAYHDTTPKNEGSGGLNPADGSYLNEFRMSEGVDTSYAKFHDAIDNSPYDKVTPEENQLYVGWTQPGEWFRITVEAKQESSYSVELLYTSNRGGTIALDVDGVDSTGPIAIPTTYDAADPIAWRQWHHWNLLKMEKLVKMAKGKHVLTVHILTEGNMNLAYFDFTPTAEPQL